VDIPEHPTLIRRMLDARLRQVATTKPVLVTGASGFIALHLIKQLLAAGY